jgi:uncharacterized membrane protein
MAFDMAKFKTDLRGFTMGSIGETLFEMLARANGWHGFAINEALIALFQGLVAELHTEELGQIGEVHLQEVVLLEIFKLGASA